MFVNERKWFISFVLLSRVVAFSWNKSSGKMSLDSVVSTDDGDWSLWKILLVPRNVEMKKRGKYQ